MVFDTLRDRKLRSKSLFMIDPRAVSYEMKNPGDGLGKTYVKDNPKYKNYLPLPEVSLKIVFADIKTVMI
jgi:hypothetical protein